MYALTMTIDHYYWKWDHEHYCARQAEKEALESYFQKQGNTFTSSTAMASQNKANLSPVALFTKNSFSKSSLCSTLKKQSNTLQIDLSSKLASNDKLTSNKHKKYLKNNLCLYCSVSSLQTVDLVPLYFIFHFHFILFSFLIFLFLEKLGLGSEVIGHTVTSVTIWWCGHNIGHETWENKVEGFRINDIIQHGYHMLTSCSTHGHLG